MTRDIHPLTSGDIPELSRFLIAGFRAPPEADYASPEVLHWKYLEQHDPPNAEIEDADTSIPRSYIARDETRAIIGHLGLCRTAFEGRAIPAHYDPLSTIHIIDWLGSSAHHSVGISLMRKAHEGTMTQFGLGVSEAALLVGERAGYQLRSLVPVYSRILSAGYSMRSSGSSLVSRGFRLVRDFASQWIQRPIDPRVTIQLKRVAYFGPEINSIVDQAKGYAILTRRDPSRLNAMLRFPRQTMTGWHLVDTTGRLRGLAVLNIIPKDQGRTRMGKIVDCLLDDIAIDPWHAAMLALTHELAYQGADVAQAYASTPWTAEALRQSGYKSRFAVKFHIRDRLALIPREAIFHMTPLEGDYAYT